ncbi:MAG: signal peptidase I [Clostridia bacterium]|nr:signal peptidase I [Clostridia bacterium]
MKIIKKLLTILVMLILLSILFVSGVILVNSYIHPDEVPSFFGWKPFIVLSGSMEAQIMPGDIVVVKEVDVNTLKRNDIIAFKEDNVVITHRIIEVIEENGKVKYKTKGDNNNIEDGGYVLQSQVEGLYQFRIGKLGNLALFIQTPIGMVVCISIPLMMLALVQIADSRKGKEIIAEKEKSMEEEIEKLRKQNEELLKK